MVGGRRAGGPASLGPPLQARLRQCTPVASRAGSVILSGRPPGQWRVANPVWGPSGRHHPVLLRCLVLACFVHVLSVSKGNYTGCVLYNEKNTNLIDRWMNGQGILRKAPQMNEHKLIKWCCLLLGMLTIARKDTHKISINSPISSHLAGSQKHN